MCNSTLYCAICTCLLVFCCFFGLCSALRCRIRCAAAAGLAPFLASAPKLCRAAPACDLLRLLPSICRRFRICCALCPGSRQAISCGAPAACVAARCGRSGSAPAKCGGCCCGSPVRICVRSVGCSASACNPLRTVNGLRRIPYPLLFSAPDTVSSAVFCVGYGIRAGIRAPGIGSEALPDLLRVLFWYLLITFIIRGKRLRAAAPDLCAISCTASEARQNQLRPCGCSASLCNPLRTVSGSSIHAAGCLDPVRDQSAGRLLRVCVRSAAHRRRSGSAAGAAAACL